MFAQTLPPWARDRPEMVPFAAANCTAARIAAHLGSHDRTILDTCYAADTDGWPRFPSGQVPPEPLHVLIRRKG